ncbi:hypothetical protein DICPUDRAFT_32286 [Dictyostelium purpureum]|uniref:Vacuolar protein sorting-associated protein 16 homolog n=1 Tax=Dictyostelium purpureum TaxID=5786 RepID=F0ZIS5_DICPU|nr:uncharacterized protein DICPUDRAFT_32286 [Dictyostelium purpureum]EGC36173.1 hypothetical protein DICPUDRAFT_32286 [Dictyostelium purpureum]|eukprot:XP_003287306.1 hypothetical protein DICPUDRAFT_32286 [Dictyostelium purpureum]
MIAAHWKNIGNSTYIKKEIYSMEWDVDLKQQVAVAAPFAGPIAVMRDSTKFVEVNSQNMKPYLKIYTAAGTLMSQMIWDSSKKIVAMDWIEKERLVLVLQDATVLIYNIFCELKTQFTLGDVVRQEEILECKIWSDGIVVLTSAAKLYSVPSINDFFEENGKVIRLPQIPEEFGEKRPEWAILEPQFSLTQSLEIYMSINGTLYLIDEDKVEAQLDSTDILLKMEISPCGKKLACFDRKGTLLILNIDGSHSSAPERMDTKSPKVPTLKWCGSDGIVMYWDSIAKEPVFIFFSNGDWAKITLEQPVSLVTEIDGVRIISDTTSEFFHRVSDVTVDLFKIGTTSPSSILYDATEHFINKSPQADESIRSIRDSLQDAVNSCILAAGYEFSGAEQSKLLKAASFGKCFLDSYNPLPFVTMCRNLRVLNAVRHHEIGIPLSIQQFRYIGIDELIDRLINRRKHLLAWRICDYLKIKSDVVLNHWACTKVRTDIPDQELSQIIIKKLESVPGISFANIASQAFLSGRSKVATKLLEYEPKAAEQVPPLIKMGESGMALNKAIESGDTDLVYLVLLSMKRNLEISHFLEVTFSKTVALDLLINMCKQKNDLPLLREIYDIKGQIREMSNIFLTEAFRNPDLDGRMKAYHKAIDCLRQSKDKEDQSTLKNVEDQIKLEMLQKELETSLQEQFEGMSISDTIYKLISLNQGKRANSIKSEFKVPDKRFWWIKIKALSIMCDWEELMKFSKDKKSPIGYEPFVEVCLEQKNQIEALKYIPRITESLPKVQFYIQISYFREAADIAFKEKNVDLLNLVAKKCTNPEVLKVIEQMFQQLRR